MDTHFLWDLFLLDLDLSSPWILWARRSPLSFLHLWTCATSKLSHKALASWPLLGCQQSKWHLQHSKKAELKKKEKDHYIWKWFEPRSNIPWLKKTIWVIGVQRKTNVCDWHLDNLCGSDLQSLSLKMVSAQVVEMSVTNNSPSQDSNHRDDLFQSG